MHIVVQRVANLSPVFKLVQVTFRGNLLPISTSQTRVLSIANCFFVSHRAGQASAVSPIKLFTLITRCDEKAKVNTSRVFRFILACRGKLDNNSGLLQ